MEELLIEQIENKHERFMRDESSAEGSADSISFPESAEDVSRIMRSLSESGESRITVQGALTGLNGRAVPHGGHVINMSRMDKILGTEVLPDGSCTISVQAGVTLKGLNTEIARSFRKQDLCWLPSPSEDSATVGGVVSTGAFGINTAGYGGCAEYLSALEYVNEAGEITELTDTGSIRQFLAENGGRLPVTALTLKLSARPEAVWGVAFFFGDGEQAAFCADVLADQCEPEGVSIPVKELITHSAIETALTAKETMGASWTIPDLPEGATDIIYIEVEGADEDIENAVMELSETAALHGSDIDSAWALSGETEIGKMHLLRHAVTEGAASEMAALHAEDKGLHLVTADIPVEGQRISEALGECDRRLSEEGIRAAVCCSIGAKVIRIVMIPDSITKLDSALSLAGVRL